MLKGHAAYVGQRIFSGIAGLAIAVNTLDFLAVNADAFASQLADYLRRIAAPDVAVKHLSHGRATG
jgi:hypothetical protein